MSTAVRILISAIGVGAMLATPVMARTRAHHLAVGPRAVVDQRAVRGAYGGTLLPSMPRTGEKYFGPYDERIVTTPDGTVVGTDPDAFIRNQMRRDGGPRGNNTTSGN